MKISASLVFQVIKYLYILKYYSTFDVLRLTPFPFFILCVSTVIKENAEALIMASKEIGLEVNVDITKYMVMSRDKIAGRSHTMKIDNRSYKMVEGFKYLGTSLTNQNSIQEEIRAD